MELYFKDRIPDGYQGQNQRYYDAIDVSGTVRLPDVKLVMKNNVPAGREGTPLNAGNLNYASGNIVMPAAGNVRKGDVVSMTGGAVGSANTVREVAAYGLDFSVAALANGFLRLSDNKLLLIYTDRMVVATVDFANQTVSFGEYLTVNTTFYHLYTLSLIRSFDDSPVAVVCGLGRDPNNASVFTIVMYRIDETGAITLRQLPLSSSYLAATNAVRVSNSQILMCMKDGGTLYMTLYSINSESSPYFTQEAQISLAGFGAIGQTLGTTLFTYDKANNRHMLIYTNGQYGQVYALPISVSGITVTAGTPQLLGTATDTLHEAAYMSGGTNRFTPDNNRIILTNVSSSTATKIQILSINASGTVTKGTIYDAPLAYMASSFITYNDGGIYIAGATQTDASHYEGCLLDIKINGTTAVVEKLMPFMPLNATAMGAMRHAVYENPDNPGEFLFMQGYNQNPLTNLRFWYGSKYDGTKPNNVIGIALENASGGYVRVQATGKHLPGIFSGLTTGQFYQAGDNGGLIPVSGAAGGNANALGIATSPTDFLFFGARAI